ncbi:MAG: hypothetical protein GMKNLPBB_01999 [Myxococcota bacterium]|nr:hypothetical protein [Myxococcota bacterium]
MTKTAARARANARKLGNVPTQLAALETMNVGALAEKYRELYGEPARTRNKDYLKKRLAWRIQELAGGGLPPGAVALINQFGDQMPERWRMRMTRPATTENEAPALLHPVEPRDPRLPPPGAVLRRVFEGAAHEVTVCDEGFEYAGQRYKSLSAIAQHITGTRWNGFLFFGLKKRGAEDAA